MRTIGRDERRPDAGSVRAALTLALAAPSVHNSQPWQWRWDGVHATDDQGVGAIDLYADRTRWLRATDPRGTDLLVSCGVVLHHARVAFAAEGWDAQAQYLPDATRPDHLARLTFRAAAVEPAHVTLAEAILSRRTDRRWFAAHRVPDELLAELIAAAEHRGARVTRLTRPGFRVGLTETLRASRLQNWDPRYLDELARVTNRFQLDASGIPAANRTGTTSHMNRTFPAGTLADPAPADGPERAEVVVLGADEPGPLGALTVGEACSAVLLGATAAGLASCVMSQPLESATARRRLREVLDVPMEPLALVRLGWPVSADPVPPTPRRPLAEMLLPSDAMPKVPGAKDLRPVTTIPADS
jgi:nitroreductase